MASRRTMPALTVIAGAVLAVGVAEPGQDAARPAGRQPQMVRAAGCLQRAAPPPRSARAESAGTDGQPPQFVLANARLERDVAAGPAPGAAGLPATAARTAPTVDSGAVSAGPTPERGSTVRAGGPTGLTPRATPDEALPVGASPAGLPTNGAGSTEPSSVVLDDPSGRLAAYVGQEVEVSGTLLPYSTPGTSAAGAPSPLGTPATQAVRHRVQVASVRPIGGGCQ